MLSMMSFALVAACTPGPNNIMLTASGVNYGFARSAPHMAGVVVGFTVVLAAATAGLGAIFMMFPVAYTVLKIAGALYLLWLAWKVASAGQPQRSEREMARPLTFFQAAAFQWVNPKGMLISLSAVTLFLPPGAGPAAIAAMLAVFSAATLVSVLIWTAFGTVVSRLLRDPLHARIFNVAMALLLVASIVPMVI
jgi:threonine/homoserine/homoserine lactone efflux protein